MKLPLIALLNEEDGMKAPCVVNLHAIVTVPQQKLGRRLVQLSPERMRKICAAANFAIGCTS